MSDQRSQALLDIRPVIASATVNDEMSPEEQFQNQQLWDQKQNKPM